MNLYYNMEIQMKHPNEVTDDVIEKIAQILGVGATEVDERETYTAVFFFKSEIPPSQMFIKVRDILFFQFHTIYYIDVMYRWETEMNADRYVCWEDGREKHYTGRIVFEEDK